MLKAAREHGLAFAPPKLSLNLKRQLPAFYHLGTPPKTYRAPKIDCLAHNHSVTAGRVGDLIRSAKRLYDPPSRRPHFPLRRCACHDCKLDRTHGCLNPHQCAKMALTILSTLSPIANTFSQGPDDNLTLTHHRLEKNREARAERGAVVFDPSLTIRTSLADCFRIFLDPKLVSPDPAYRLEAPAPGLNVQREHLTIYTDGSCLDNGKANARAGSGIYVRPDHPLNRAIRIPGPEQSNQVGELVAIIVALQTAPPFAPITFITD
ncbi:RnaseH-domain-containing protein, partial [Gloeophyllum trabeum ATCC 11539]